MACVNWHMVISIAIVLAVKAVGTTFFLLYHGSGGESEAGDLAQPSLTQIQVNCMVLFEKKDEYNNNNSMLPLMPQIFPPVLEESSNSTSTERNTTVPWISTTPFEENFSYSTTGNSRTVSPTSSVNSAGNITPKTRGTDCPVRWDFYKGSCYFFSTNERNWNQSQARCFNEAATLAIINSAEEQKFLRERAASEIYFIGLRYQRSQKRWQWTDGSGFVVNIVNDTPNFDCGTIGLTETLDKSSCEISHRWICEKKAL